MTRNLHRRVELMFPIYDEILQKKLFDMLNTYWNDNKKAWKLNADGTYTKIHPKNALEIFSAQEYYLDELNKLRKKIKTKTSPSFKR